MNLLGIGKYLRSGNFNVWVTFRPPPPPYVKELFLHGVDIYLKSPNIFSFKGRQIAFFSQWKSQGTVHQVNYGKLHVSVDYLFYQINLHSFVVCTVVCVIKYQPEDPLKLHNKWNCQSISRDDCDWIGPTSKT